MPRWFASTSRRRSLVWPAVGLVFGGMSVVETAIDTVFDYGMVTALPGVVVGLLLALCPRWPASAAVLGSLTVDQVTPEALAGLLSAAGLDGDLVLDARVTGMLQALAPEVRGAVALLVADGLFTPSRQQRSTR